MGWPTITEFGIGFEHESCFDSVQHTNRYPGYRKVERIETPTPCACIAAAAKPCPRIRLPHAVLGSFSRRTAGQYHICDGQRRMAAAAEASRHDVDG